MTNLITLTIPNDDHIALRAFGKALEEMALSREQTYGAQHKTNVEIMASLAHSRSPLRSDLDEGRKEPEIDTTTQQVESLTPRDGRKIEVTREMVELCAPVKPNIESSTTDNTNTPWDERIHSTSKALNADGTWRLRRKPKDMDEVQWSKYVEAVKADTTSADDDSWGTDRRPGSGGNGGVGVGESDDIEPPVTPPGDDFHTDMGVVTEQTIAGIPPIPVPPPVVVAPPVADDTVWDFPKLMKFLTERHGKIDVTTVNSLLAADGIASLQELNGNPDKIGPFVARVKVHLGE